MKRNLLKEGVAVSNPVPDHAVQVMELGPAEAILIGGIAADRRPRPQIAGSTTWQSRFHARRLAPALVLLILVATAAVSTSPGKALTRWVGERIGLGDPGGAPSLRQLRAFANEGYESDRSRVLAIGPAPGGVGTAPHGRYEFIVTWPKGPHAPEGPCFELDLTQMRSIGTDGCGILPEGKYLYFLGPGGNADPDFSSLWVTGRTGEQVASVDVRVDGRRVPVELKPIPRRLTRRFHLLPFKFFIGFARYPRESTRIDVTARDGRGRPLDHQAAHVIGASTLYAASCATLPTHPNAAAARDCRQVLGPSWRDVARRSGLGRHG